MTMKEFKKCPFSGEEVISILTNPTNDFEEWKTMNHHFRVARPVRIADLSENQKKTICQHYNSGQMITQKDFDVKG